jgi:hypothetical protein
MDAALPSAETVAKRYTCWKRCLPGATSVTEPEQWATPDLGGGTTEGGATPPTTVDEDQHTTTVDEDPQATPIDEDQQAKQNPTIKIGHVEVPQDFFETDMARQLGPGEDTDQEITPAMIEKKVSYKQKIVASIIFPSSTTPQSLLPFAADYIRLSGSGGEAIGPVAVYQMMKPNYRSAEVVIQLCYKSKWRLYELGCITTSFIGIPEDARPTADVINVEGNKEIDGDEIVAFRFPFKCGSVQTTLLGTNCQEAVEMFSEIATSVQMVRDMFGQISDLKKKDPDQSVTIPVTSPSRFSPSYLQFACRRLTGTRQTSPPGIRSCSLTPPRHSSSQKTASPASRTPSQSLPCRTFSRQLTARLRSDMEASSITSTRHSRLKLSPTRS